MASHLRESMKTFHAKTIAISFVVKIQRRYAGKWRLGEEKFYSTVFLFLFLLQTNFTHLIVPIACCGIFSAEGHPKMRSVTVN